MSEWQANVHRTVGSLRATADILEAYGAILSVEGCIVECGVAGGRSLAFLRKLVRDEGKGRQIYGFDAWEPEFQPRSLVDGERPVYQGYDAVTARILLRQYSRKMRADQVPVKLIKGRFEDTLPSFQGAPIALLNLDVDYYDSYLTCLIYLWPQVAVGGVVRFDEWDSRKWPGCNKAVQEYFGGKSDAVIGVYHQVLVTKK